MDFKKCNICGNFYLSNGLVCPKCQPKDDFEFSSFKTYIEENGLNGSVDEIADRTGISVKNINRFIEYNKESGSGNIPGVLGGNIENKASNNGDNGITFLL